MSARLVTNPIPVFLGPSGEPLSGGSVYVGAPYRDPREHPIAVYYDREMKLPARQPLRTASGYLLRDGSPTAVYVNGDHSVLVLNGIGQGVSYAASSQTGDPTVTSFRQAARGAGSRSLQDKLQDVVSVKDFVCDDGLLVQGDGLHDDTTGVHQAFEHAIRLKAAIYFPSGSYRVTSGYTNAVPGGDLVLFGVNPHYSARTGHDAGGARIALDSSFRGSFFFHQAASNELAVRDLNFACSEFVLDRPFFRTSANSTKHTFERVNFTAVEQPFVYEPGTYMQMCSYRDVRFTNSGSFHSRTSGLIATLVTIDNVDVEGVMPENTQKVVCNLSGMRFVQARNLLIEPALPSRGWVALNLREELNPGWPRMALATFDGLYIECTGNLPEHVVHQRGGHATYNDCHLNLTPSSRFDLADSAHAEIHCCTFAASSHHALESLFAFGDGSTRVTLRDVNTLNIAGAITNPHFVFENSSLGSTDPYLSTCFDNKLSQVLWEFDGGYCDPGKLQVLGDIGFPSTDARYGRKLVLPARNGSVNTVFQARVRLGPASLSQFWIALLLKLPHIAEGSVEVPLYANSKNIGGGKVFSEADSGQTKIIVLPASGDVSAATLVGFGIHSRSAHTSGTVEIYCAQIGIGRSLPSTPSGSFPVNVCTSAPSRPDSGSWSQGDYCRNSAPAPGLPRGWYCTAAGTPGTWISEGNL